MKRSALQRRKPMARGTKPMKRSTMRRAPRKRRAGHVPKMLAACRGQRCWLSIPGVCRNDVASVVPCHANWADYGKGMGLKAGDQYTVPGCRHCHAELDQGSRFTKGEKRAIWEAAYACWSPYRATHLLVDGSDLEDVPV